MAVDGKWEIVINSPMGAQKAALDITTNGGSLTGTQTAQQGSGPLENGKVDGNKISFAQDIDFGQGPITFNYTGVVSPTELKLHSSFMDMPIDIALKKAG